MHATFLQCNFSEQIVTKSGSLHPWSITERMNPLMEWGHTHHQLCIYLHAELR